MWVFSSARAKLLLVWTRRPAAVWYHVSACALSPEDIKPAAQRRRRVSQHKSAASDGRQKHERFDQRKTWGNEIPVLQSPDQRRAHDSRVPSEVRRLSLEDFPAQRMVAQKKPTLDSKEAESYEVVFGIAPCILALRQGRRKVRKLFVKDGEASNSRASVLEVCEEAHRRGVHVQRVAKTDLDKMSSGRVHQGVCLQASPLSYLAEDRDSAAPHRRDVPLWLVLERIHDPMNLGAILRSAYFLGVDRVCSGLRHSCPLTPVVSKASAGVMEVVGVYGYENLEDMLQGKAAQGWQVVGTVGAEAEDVPVTPCSHFQLTKPTVLLMGGEGEGLSRQLLSLCHTFLTVPAGRELFPGVDSLNVSVATGILLHALLSSRWSTR